MSQLDKCASNKEEYDNLWMKTKKYSKLVTDLYNKQNSSPAPAPAPVAAPAAVAPAKEAPKAPAPAPAPKTVAPAPEKK